ncbi:hypothetical protein F2P45_19395 [Massilia sp. CCM 8733]|uniref:Uncharacterized protein n=1 Tax=Massilia mucilaginosa TaxID=2609282 RepID=A0ABX0NWC8_9BURK|nr:hypothetical protein [Massilia mucilaginosa]NHZ91165.1 hypothetical protein [Massilia mucilaginosa]
MATNPLSPAFRERPKLNGDHYTPAPRLTAAEVAERTGPRWSEDWNSNVGDAAAATLTACIRAKIGSKAQGPMIATGTRWRPQHQVGQSARNISHINLTLLKFRVGDLTAHEMTFKNRLETETLHITHATNHALTGNRAVLFSRIKLQEERVSFATENTNGNDIDQLATDDHVFFALEVGDCQKPASRFGGTIHRFPFDQPAVKQQGMMHLFDALIDKPPRLASQFESIPAVEAMSDDQRTDVVDRLAEQAKKLKATNTLFHGPHIMQALTLSVIERCRALPQTLRDDLLQNGELNTIVNVLFRPQILVPRQFYGTPTQSRTSEQLDMNALNELDDSSDSSSDSEVSSGDVDFYNTNLHHGSAAPPSLPSLHSASSESGDSEGALSDFNGSISDSEGSFNLQELYTSAAQAPLTSPHSSSSEGGEWV